MELLAGAVSLALGYVIGSLPLPALVGQMAGRDEARAAAAVWRAAGPGWGLLALAVDLARGILPVALVLVTFTWPAALAAGIGAVLGTAWPAAGRLPADRSPVLLVGVLLVLAPLLGLVSAVALGVAAFMRRSPALG